MENWRGMERDHYFCGSMSTTRSHTRNQDLPQWNGHFASTAAHFSPVSVAIIVETGQLEMLRLPSLAIADIHGARKSPFLAISTFALSQITVPKKNRKLKAQCMTDPRFMTLNDALQQNVTLG